MGIKSNSSVKHNHLSSLIRWFEIVPVVFLVLLGCGQIALRDHDSSVADTQSMLMANYQTWDFNSFHLLHQAILQDIQRDKSQFPNLFKDIPEITLQTGSNWPKSIETHLPPKNTTTTPYTEPTQEQTIISPTLTEEITPTPPPPTATAVNFIPAAPPIIIWPTITPTPQDKEPTPRPTRTTIPETPTETPETPTATPETPTAIPEEPTATPETPTATPVLCSGNIPAGEPNLGLPNNVYASIACNGYIILDLSSNPIDTTSPDSDYDLVFYERLMTTTEIMFDHVVVEVSKSASGACATGGGRWDTVLYWGDSDPNNNGHLGSMFGPVEYNNQAVPITDLYGTPPLQTGIAIDLDALGLSDVYNCVRITTPINWPDNDPAEVDALQVLN